jgi:hypothetical protein
LLDVYDDGNCTVYRSAPAASSASWQGGAVAGEGAVGGEGKPGEAFADTVVGGGVGVELVGQRQFGKIGLAV